MGTPEWTIAEIVAKDKRRAKLAERVKDLSSRANDLKNDVIAGLTQHGVKAVEHGGWSITMAQGSTVEYDDKAIISELSVAQKRLCCREELDLNALTPDERKAVIAALAPGTRKRITRVILDRDKLSQAVQGNKVPLALVSRHSQVKQRAAYIAHSGPKQ